MLPTLGSHRENVPRLVSTCPLRRTFRGFACSTARVSCNTGRPIGHYGHRRYLYVAVVHVVGYLCEVGPPNISIGVRAEETNAAVTEVTVVTRKSRTGPEGRVSVSGNPSLARGSRSPGGASSNLRALAHNPFPKAFLLTFGWPSQEVGANFFGGASMRLHGLRFASVPLDTRRMGVGIRRWGFCDWGKRRG